MSSMIINTSTFREHPGSEQSSTQDPTVQNIAYGSVATLLAIGQLLIAYLHFRRNRARDEEDDADALEVLPSASRGHEHRE